MTGASSVVSPPVERVPPPIWVEDFGGGALPSSKPVRSTRTRFTGVFGSIPLSCPDCGGFWANAAATARAIASTSIPALGTKKVVMTV